MPPFLKNVVPRLKGKQMDMLRLQCFADYAGRCCKCRKKLHFVARFDGDPDAYDMAHIRNKKMWGDTIGNVRAECHECHIDGHAGNKPVPKK